MRGIRGFDRAVKPEWVYEMIQKLEVGDKISEHKEELDKVLIELGGENGKRKVKTIIGRYFLKGIDNPRGYYVNESLIFNLIKEREFKDVKASMLFNLLVKAPILQYFSEEIFRLYSGKKKINSDFLREKSYEKFGERDISRRSLRNFLKTLGDFEILERVSRNDYIWKKKLKVKEEELVIFLKLYSKFYLDSAQVSLYEMPEHLLFYFILPDVREIAQKYNGVYWDYIRRVNTALINFYD